MVVARVLCKKEAIISLHRKSKDVLCIVSDTFEVFLMLKPKIRSTNLDKNLLGVVVATKIFAQRTEHVKKRFRTDEWEKLLLSTVRFKIA